MASDDLDAPLGLNKQSSRWRFALPFNIPLGLPVAGVLILCLAAFAGWSLLHRDPLGGEPMVVIAARPGPPESAAQPKPSAHQPGPAETGAPAPSAANDPAASAPGEATPAKKTAAAGPTVTIIDGSTGKRQEVNLPSPDSRRAAAIDQRLLETTRHGPVPRASLDGTRPATVYAQAASPANPSSPRIALIVTGLGISESGTAEAIRKLPGPVTLAFVPYAAGIENTVARARGEGHEVLLQIPMEPFDYPDNDPGPQTLLTSLVPEQNIDRMHWMMSRFQGYVGVANLMGARFTATETALAPVLREVSKRGLVYLDDGSSPRSLTSQIAGANNMPFAKANVVLDAAPTQAEVERALARLETIAREEGLAVGVASALPLSIERIAQWAKSAEGRGFALVPITAVAVRAKGS